MHFNDVRCKGLTDYWPDRKLNEELNGDFYAPFVIERYTTSERTFYPRRKAATIYWLLSTWNPYQVVVMRTRLQVDTPLLGTTNTTSRLVVNQGGAPRHTQVPPGIEKTRLQKALGDPQ